MKKILNIMMLIIITLIVSSCGDERTEHKLNDNVSFKVTSNYTVSEVEDGYINIVDEDHNYVIYLTTGYFTDSRKDIEARKKDQQELHAGKVKDYKIDKKTGYYVIKNESIIIEAPISEKQYLQVVLETLYTDAKVDELLEIKEIKEVLNSIKIK